MQSLDYDLKKLRQSAPPPERLDAVRARVLARIESRSRVLPLIWMAGSAATAAFALLLWGPLTPERKTLRFDWNLPAPPAFAWKIPERRPVPNPKLAAAPALRPQQIQVVDWTESTDEQPGTALLQLPSTDPNVLLYFIVAAKGD